jgi:hypothetical protein
MRDLLHLCFVTVSMPSVIKKSRYKPWNIDMMKTRQDSQMPDWHGVSMAVAACRQKTEIQT